MGHSSKYPSNSVCEICLQGKLTRKPFKKLSEQRKTKNLIESNPSNVYGPLNLESHNGKRYFITFIDHYSYFAEVHFMKKKVKLFKKF